MTTVPDLVRAALAEFAQTLHIKQLTPDHESTVFDPALHKAQTKFLCRAIKTLINVKTVQ